MRPLRLLEGLLPGLLLALLPATTAAQDERDAVWYLGVSNFAGRRERDADLEVSPASARAAAAELEQGIPNLERRAAALMAVGLGGEPGQRGRLESFARVGETAVRKAAILALGELGELGEEPLLALVDELPPELEECGLLALARCGGRSARARVEALANLLDPNAAAARALLGFADGTEVTDPPAVPGAPGAIELLLELRWQAARTYGFVGGVRWKVRLLQSLTRDQAFLDRVILTAAADLRPEIVKDHVLEAVLAGGTADRLRGAVLAMPVPLAQLIDSGLWRPAGEAEWTAMLSAISEQGDPRPFEEPLEVIAARGDSDEVRVRASLLLLRGGRGEAFVQVVGELEAVEPRRRVAVAEALGGLADPERLAYLTRLRRDPDARVRAAALVSLVRVGHEPAAYTLQEVLESGTSDARALAIEMLCRVAYDKRVHGWLDDVLLLEGLKEPLGLLVELSLSRHGSLATLENLRARFAAESPQSSALLQLLVESLARDATPKDVELMRGMFPAEADLELNARLALALIRSRDPAGLGVVRAAIWQTPWNRSVLAAGLLVRARGIQGLHDELASAPTEARPEDLRRIGYALGQWGGLAAVEALARRRGSGDPALQ
ncbi:MAG: HEAT repeat domain-containing protein, partial [Proteobacteria bacterium]|nr:HEAT repeat domain-containing protein [Pseudomonadota bacterium]